MTSSNIDIITNTLVSIFSTILTMSIQAAIVAVFVILIRKIFLFRSNVRMGYLLWALVFIRLLLPMLPESPASIFNFTGYIGFNLNGKISSWHSWEDDSKILTGEDNIPSSRRSMQEDLPSNRQGDIPGSMQGEETQSTAVSNSDRTNSSNSSSASAVQGLVPGTGASSINLPALNILLVLSYIWAIGAIVITAFLIMKNLAFALHLKAMPPIDPPRTLSKMIQKLKSMTGVHRPVKFVEDREMTSPCVFGITRCTIILPDDLLRNNGLSNNMDDNNMDDTDGIAGTANMDDMDDMNGIDSVENMDGANNAGINREAMFHVLAHEFAHIKHNDLAVCWLISLVCAVHWFNPLVWYCSKLIRRDQELCADAYAMSLLGKEDFVKYGQTLLSMIRKDKRQSLSLIAAGITENKNAIKERIINIAAFAKNKYRFTLTGLLAILIAGVFLCTSRLNYPQSAEERMKFDGNIMMSFMLSDNQNPGNIELQITNNNDIAVHSCQIEIYSKHPNKPDSMLVYEKKNFRIGGKKSARFNLVDVDYHDAYCKFSYKVGFAFDKYSNMTWRSGPLVALDNTIQANANIWSGVSDEEVNSFIEENNINPTAINKVYGLYTIITFENGDWQGYYELCKNSKTNKLSSRRIIGYSPANDRPPVQMLGGTASGNFPFIQFKINSPALLALGDKIQIQTSNGTIDRCVSGKAVHAVETRGYGGISKILIYNKNGELIYDGEKLLLKDVNFKPDDSSYMKIIKEKGYKIVNQTPVSCEISFTPGMFPRDYAIAYKSGDIDWKIPVFTYENTTVYLKSIVEANESPDFLYAMFYFVHDAGKSSGNILSSTTINYRDGTPYSYGSNVIVKRDVFSPILKTAIKDAVSLRGYGPGDQIAIYLDRSMVEKTGGEFTVTLEGLNQISYVPESQYTVFDEQKKKQIRDMVYNQLVEQLVKAGSIYDLTGEEEIYATVGRKGQKVMDLDLKELVDVSGKYVYYISFHTEQDGWLGPITALVDPKTEKIIGVFLRY